jgi:PhzF family phenazine biosynthesis protein
MPERSLVSSVTASVTALVFGRAGEHASGNPATVIWLDQPLDDAALMREARARNTPATTFILPGEPTRVRFFTRERELAFCGHGSLAAGAAVARRNRALSAHLRAGDRDVIIELEHEHEVATLIIPGVGVERDERDPEPVLRALGVGEAVGEVVVASVGSPKWLIEVPSIKALRAVQPDMTALAALSEAAAVNGAYVYARRGAPAGVDALARGFNPRGGVDEDAATGVAAGGLAWHLRDQLAGRSLTVEQGIGLRDLNRLVARVAADHVRVGGKVWLERELP